MNPHEFRSFQKTETAIHFVAGNRAYFLGNSARSIPLVPYRQKNVERAESAFLPISAIPLVPSQLERAERAERAE